MFLFSAVCTSIISWQAVVERRLMFARVLQLFDNMLWAAVPLSTACLCTEPSGVAFMVAVYGCLACHWATNLRTSVFLYISIFSPPWIVVFVVPECPWLIAEIILFIGVAVLVGRMTHTRMLAQERQERHLQALERDMLKTALSPAQMVLSEMKRLDSGTNSSILYLSVERAARILRVLECARVSWTIEAVAEVLREEQPNLQIKITSSFHYPLPLEPQHIVALIDGVLHEADTFETNKVVFSIDFYQGMVWASVKIGEIGPKTSAGLGYMPPSMHVVRGALQRIGGDVRTLACNSGASYVLECPR